MANTGCGHRTNSSTSTNTPVNCTCNDCTESSNCLFYTNRLIRVETCRPITPHSSAKGDNASCCTTRPGQTINNFISLRLNFFDFIESFKNLCFQSRCAEQSRSAQQICSNLENQRNITDELNKTNLKPRSSDCVCSRLQKQGAKDVNAPQQTSSCCTTNKLDLPKFAQSGPQSGYTSKLDSDLPKSTQSKPQQKSDNTNTYERGYVYAVPKPKNRHKNAAPAIPVGQCYPGYLEAKGSVYDVPKPGAQQQSDNTNTFERGYVYAVPKPKNQHKNAAPAIPVGQCYPGYLEAKGSVYDVPKPGAQQVSDNSNKYDRGYVYDLRKQQAVTTAKQTLDSRGYVYPVPKQQNAQEKNAPPTSKVGQCYPGYLDIKGYVYDILKASQSAPQQQADNNNKYERGYVYDVPKPKNVTSTSSDSRGFVYELPKKKKMHDSGDKYGQQQQQFDETRGYVYVVPKQKNQQKNSASGVKAGHCYPGYLTNKGYVYDVPKTTSHTDICSCKSTQDTKHSKKSNPLKVAAKLYIELLRSQKTAAEAMKKIYLQKTGSHKSGFCLDLLKQKASIEALKKIYLSKSDSRSQVGFQKNDIEALKRIYLKKAGSGAINKLCKPKFTIDELKRIYLQKTGSRKSGFCFNLPKQKACVEALKKIYLNKSDSRSQVESQKNNIEALKRIYLKKAGAGAANTLCTPKLTIDELKRIYLPKDRQTKCKCQSKTHKKHVESTGSKSPCLQDNVSNKGAISCKSLPELMQNRIKQLVEMLSAGLQQNKRYECKHSSKNPLDSSESQKNYCKSSKPSHDSNKNKAELCKNILEIQKNAIDTLTSLFQTNLRPTTPKQDKKACCNESTKIPEQSQHKQYKCQHRPNESQKGECVGGEVNKKRCACGESITVPSEHSGNLQKQHKCQHKCSKNKSKPIGYPMDVNKVQHTCQQSNTDSFSQKDDRKYTQMHRCGCVIEVSNDSQKGKCACDKNDQSPQRSSSKTDDKCACEGGNKKCQMSQRTTSQTENKCACKGGNKKCQMLQTNKQAIAARTDTKCACLGGNKIPKDTQKVKTETHKKACECGEQSKGSTKSSTLKAELPQHLDLTNFSYKITSCNCGCNDCQKVQKYAHPVPVNCACNADKQKGMTQNTQVNIADILEKQKEATDTLKNIYLMQKDIGSSKGTQDTNHLKKSNSRKDAAKIYIELLGSQKNAAEAMQKIYLQKTGSRKNASGFYFDLLKQKASIEALKKIYLNKSDSRSPVGFQKNNIEALKRIYLQKAGSGAANKLCTPKFTMDELKRIYLPPKSATNSKECCNAPTPTTNDTILYHCSVSSKQPCNLDTVAKLSKTDILKRFKEYAYKARSQSKSSQIQEDCKCNNSQSKYSGAIKKQQPCECTPCDCLKCSKTLKSCGCDPCQCLECQSLVLVPQTLVVAPVEESIPRVACSCAPCDCIECEHLYPAASSVRHEVSTETRHALCRCEMCLNETCDNNVLDTCNCQARNKVMNKPVEKVSRDFDIRTVSVVHNLFRDNTKRIKRKSTLAMFATVSNDFRTFTSNNSKSSSTKICNCGECDFFSTICKKDSNIAIKRTSAFNSMNISTRNNAKSNICYPCECKMCENHMNDIFDERVNSNSSCRCCNCDYLTCDGDRRTKHGLCVCSSCECIEPESKRRKMFNELCYGEDAPKTVKHSIQSGAVLIPFTNQRNDNCYIKEKQLMDTIRLSASMQNMTSDMDFNLNIDDDSKYHTKCHIYKTPSEFLKPTKEGVQTYTKDSKHKLCDERLTALGNDEILKRNCYTQYKNRNGKTLPKNNCVDNESSFSGLSSFQTSPSCHRDCDSISPISQIKDKSSDSSCNSSGHDYTQYLIKFPKSTVQTCLNDVMNLDTDNILSLDKMARDNISEEEKLLLLSNEFDSVENYDSKVIYNNPAESMKHNKIESSHEKPNNDELSNWKLDLSEKSDNRVNERLNKQNCKQKSHENNLNTRGEELTKSTSLYLKNSPTEINHQEFDLNKSHPNELDINERLRKRPHYYVVNDINTHNIEDDYKRAQKTIKDTKEFSLELMRLLKIYEKANKEFESVSEKFKMSRESILGLRNVEQKQITSLQNKTSNEGMGHELQGNNLESPFTLEEVTSAPGRTNLSKDILNYINVNKRSEEDCSSKIKLESASESNVVQQIARNVSQYHENDAGVRDSNTNKIISSSHDLGRKGKERLNTKNNKKYSNPVKNIIIISKSVSINNSNTAKKKPFVKYYSNVSTSTALIGKGELNDFKRKLTTELRRTEEVSVSPSNEPQLESNHVFVCNNNHPNIIQDRNEPRNWSILKKNVEMKTSSTRIKSTIPPLSLERKEEVRAISLEASSLHELHNGNKAREKLQDEVKDLLNMSVLQPQTVTTQVSIEDPSILPNKDNLDLEEPAKALLQTESDYVNQCEQETVSSMKDNMATKIRELLNLTLLRAHVEKKLFSANLDSAPPENESSSSCESLKVGAVDVRRMSDHSVLVKWNVPKDLTRVQGYQLLVDGRPILTIFSPSKSTAVVSCLPNTDRVLLTVRTIISSETNVGHYPATTVVYRP